MRQLRWLVVLLVPILVWSSIDRVSRRKPAAKLRADPKSSRDHNGPA